MQKKRGISMDCWAEKLNRRSKREMVGFQIEDDVLKSIEQWTWVHQVYPTNDAFFHHLT